MFETKIKPSQVLKAPYIKIDVITSHSIKDTTQETKYVIAPTAKKIGTYIVNQIFGSDLITQTEGLNINWLMPTLKEALELSVYQEESFIYIHKYDDKIYLECIKKTDIHDLVQKYDKIISGTIRLEIEGKDKTKYILDRKIKLEDGITKLKLTAYEEKANKDLYKISIDTFNRNTGNDYLENYILPYEALINIDLGQKFFKDSEKLLNEEMNVINVIADEIEKTRTRIATTQHYQTGDISGQWKPGATQYNVGTLTVGSLKDYFTLLPGDREHAIFEFLQGNVRTQEYYETFKFYDQQIIQMAGLSPASFGYEKDNYMNVDNVDLSKNNSEMTIEAIKTQIEPQINKLLENIVKAQRTQNIKVNLIPDNLNWNYGDNEKLTDLKKVQLLGKINNVASVPYKQRAKVIAPMLKRLLSGEEYDDDVEELVKEYEQEQKDMKIEFGEI